MPSQISTHLKEQAALYVMGALSPEEKTEFDRKLKDSHPLRIYVEELADALEAVSRLPGKQPSESFLERQRNLLGGRIDMVIAEPFHAPFVRKLKRAIQTTAELFLFGRRPALAAVTYVLLGLVVGRFLLVPSAAPDIPTGPSMTAEQKIQKFMELGELVADRIDPVENGTNKVAFRLKAEDEFTYTGGLQDETVRELLAYLLLNEANPGKRLRSIKLMSEFAADDEMKLVLGKALLSDENPGVRLRAIKNLANFPMDETIRNTCVKTLLEEENTAVRMEALNILGRDPDERLIPVLQVVSRLDENEFIRDEASKVLDQITGSYESEPIEEIR